MKKVFSFIAVFGILSMSSLSAQDSLTAEEEVVAEQEVMTEEVVAEEVLAEEEVVTEESSEESAGISQALKLKFIEGGPLFMSFVLRKAPFTFNVFFYVKHFLRNLCFVILVTYFLRSK